MDKSGEVVDIGYRSVSSAAILFPESRELVAMMQGHESTIHAISLHASGRYAMATSADSAQLWDLDSFQRKRRLTVKEEVPIVKVVTTNVQLLTQSLTLAA